MNTRRKIALAVVMVLLVAAATYEARLIREQRIALAVLRAEVQGVEKEIAAGRAAQAAEEVDFKTAAEQLAALPAIPPAGPEARTDRGAEIHAWAARLARLKRIFADRPDQSIPELKLLTDADWLRIARRVEFESETALRQALAQVRDVARNKFRSPLAEAMRKFVRASPGGPPGSITALAPYFSGPVDVAMLQRYEIAPDEAPGGRPSTWVVREAAAVDADYDGRAELLSTGGTRRMGSPLAWVPGIQERLTRALTAFRQKSGSPVTSRPSELIPFFDPPLTPAQTEALLRREREGK